MPLENQYSYDRFDQHVIDQIEEAGLEEVTRDLLERFFRETEIHRPKTLRRRIKDLVKHGPFERCGTQRWVYLPHRDR